MANGLLANGKRLSLSLPLPICKEPLQRWRWICIVRERGSVLLWLKRCLCRGEPLEEVEGTERMVSIHLLPAAGAACGGGKRATERRSAERSRLPFRRSECHWLFASFLANFLACSQIFRGGGGGGVGLGNWKCSGFRGGEGSLCNSISSSSFNFPPAPVLTH